MTEETNDERRARVCRELGIRLEDITTWENEGAPQEYHFGACVGGFDLGVTVGTGRTPEDAIEDLIGELESADLIKQWEDESRNRPQPDSRGPAQPDAGQKRPVADPREVNQLELPWPSARAVDRRP